MVNVFYMRRKYWKKNVDNQLAFQQEKRGQSTNSLARKGKLNTKATTSAKQGKSLDVKLDRAGGGVRATESCGQTGLWTSWLRLNLVRAPSAPVSRVQCLPFHQDDILQTVTSSVLYTPCFQSVPRTPPQRVRPLRREP